MRTVAIIQARMGSSRLPGKVLADLEGRPMLLHVAAGASAATRVDDVVIATTRSQADDAIVDLCRGNDLAVVRGSEDDVLDRYHDAALAHGADLVVRLTADCPFLDPSIIDRVIDAFDPERHDYVSNVQPPTFPDGLDTEVFSLAALTKAWREASLRSEREHVTPYIRNHPALFRTANVAHHVDLSAARWTVDEPADLDFARRVLARIGTAPFRMEQLIDLLAREPGLTRINAGIARNEGYEESLRADGPAARDVVAR